MEANKTWKLWGELCQKWQEKHDERKQKGKKLKGKCLE